MLTYRTERKIVLPVDFFLWKHHFEILREEPIVISQGNTRAPRIIYRQGEYFVFIENCQKKSFASISFEEKKRLLIKAMKKLEYKEKTAIELIFGVNNVCKKKEDIAEKLSLNLAGLEDLIQRSLQKLKKILEIEINYILENERTLEDYE